jgi:endonuclease/exonuclease/phosphatase family metal-dependent hydrolase
MVAPRDLGEDAAADAAAEASDQHGPDLSSWDLHAPDLAGTVDAAGSTRVRIMAANLTSGTGQSYDPGHGIRIFQGLKPDVVLIQEFNYKMDTDADLRAMVDTAFGPSFSYYRQPAGPNIPNGVISRYPIKSAGVWDDPLTADRDLVWARLDVPGPTDLWAVSVHLLTSSSSDRAREANTLVGFILAQVPSTDYLVIGGDFNTDSRNESCITSLGRVVVTDPMAAPYPVDQTGNGNTNMARAKPYDWVLAGLHLNPLRTAVVVGGSNYPGGLVFDSRVYTPLAEAAPVQAGDSGAKGMQHMAVVKDFLLPN